MSGNLPKEVRDAIDELNRTFESFKAANDKLIDERVKGRVDAVLNDQVERTNEAVTSATAKVEELMARQQERSDELEARMNRLALGGNDPSGGDELKAAAAWSAHVRGCDVSQVEASGVDLDQYRAYKAAMRSYIRSGPDGLMADVRNTLTTGKDPDGGYWVHTEMSDRIVEFVYETSPMRQFASVDAIGTDAVEGLYDLDETGGGWVGENATRTDTDTPDAAKWRIDVHEQYEQPKASNRNLEDAAFDVEAWLIRKSGSKFARRENAAFVTGDGVGKPRGFLTYTAGTPTSTAFNVVEQIVSGANGAFASSDPGDKLIDMLYALKSVYRANATWAMNRLTQAAVRKLKDGDGNYLWVPNFQEGRGPELLGQPIADFEDMPALATNSLSLAIADWAECYSIRDRSGITLLRDPYTTKGFTKFYMTKRVGGGVINFEAIKIMKFAAS